MKIPNVDFDFIYKQESGGTDIIIRPYVPKDHFGKVLGNSGVTIGHGCDLGHQDITVLEGVSENTTAYLTPFLGLQKDAAVHALDESGVFDVPEHECYKMTENAYTRILETVGSRLRATGQMEWAELPIQVATVTASIAIQYGAHGIEHKCPSFWRYLIAKDWSGMYSELKDFGDAYTTRRHAEAELIHQLFTPTE